MGKIIAVANQKGGVGKTTTVINLAAYMGKNCGKTLIVDCDTQGNATTGLGIRKSTLKNTIYEVITGKCAVKDAIIDTEFQNLSIIPSSSNLASIEVDLSKMDERLHKLKKQLLTIKDDYEYILIDCPPALGFVTLNALVAANELLVPMSAEFYALEGLSQLNYTIKAVKKNHNPNLEICGIVFTMYDNRLNISKQVVEEVEKYFPGKVFDTKIPRNVKLAESPSYGKPVLYYDKHSNGSEAYRKLCGEMTGKDGRKGFKSLFKR